jgi:hypothetical protein
MDSLADFTPENLKQWSFGSGTFAPKGQAMQQKDGWEGPSERNYTLKSRDPKKFLQYEEQSVGINLGWTDDAEPSTADKVRRWFLNRPGSSGNPITYGEPLALGYGKSPSYIAYARRDIGINLDWFSSPKFEWRLMGGTPGSVVKTGDYLGIYNDTSEEFLIYFNRTAGGDIGWPSSQTWWDQAKDKAIAAAKEYAKSQLGGK